MTLRLRYLACTALTAAALVMPALAEETVTMKRSELEAIMNRLDRLEKQVSKGGAPAGGGTAELEQRVKIVEMLNKDGLIAGLEERLNRLKKEDSAHEKQSAA